ncbi:MAG: 30S ribosome-binding factor RbfA [Caedimonas sp.]|nr:30S ribosome-binding factor RbfA [Caedimonas sp.]
MTRSRPPLMPSQRQLRVAEEIRHVLARILSRVDHFDDVIQKAHVTVTEVRVSPDLKFAKVYIMPIGGRDKDIVLEALNKAASFYRFEVGRQLTIKFTPALQFRIDETFDQVSRIETLLQSAHVKQDLQ